MRRRSGIGLVNLSKVEQRNKSAADSKEEGKSKWDDINVWLGCLALRILNALLVRTYFNPDEHWQALEVAHRLVFG